MNRKRMHREWQLTFIDIIREWLIIGAIPPMSKQFALTSACTAFASDNFVAPRNKGEHVCTLSFRVHDALVNLSLNYATVHPEHHGHGRQCARTIGMSIEIVAWWMMAAF